uniref:Uncharacterized protein n=1 Tax=Panagrolaimus superbus TaxID=310955 RepID=A0A914YHK7_9BILA
MVESFGTPILSGISPPLASPSTTYSPSKRPQHRHRILSPPRESYSLEEKLKARRKEQRERHLEAVLAEVATKGSSDSTIMNEHFNRFVDDNNSKLNINIGKEKTSNQTGVKVPSTLSTSPGPLPLPAPTQSTVKVINSDEILKSGKEDSGGLFTSFLYH